MFLAKCALFLTQGHIQHSEKLKMGFPAPLALTLLREHPPSSAEG